MSLLYTFVDNRCRKLYLFIRADTGLVTGGGPHDLREQFCSFLEFMCVCACVNVKEDYCVYLPE